MSKDVVKLKIGCWSSEELEARDEKMQGYLSNQDLNHSAYCTSLEVETHMPIP